MDGLVDLGHPRCGVAGPVELTRRERVDRVLPRKMSETLSEMISEARNPAP
jgi:hypothetical protein